MVLGFRQKNGSGSLITTEGRPQGRAEVVCCVNKNMSSLPLRLYFFKIKKNTKTPQTCISWCSLFQTTKYHCLNNVWDLKITGWDICQQNHSWNPETSAKSHQVRIWPCVFSWLTFPGNIDVVGWSWTAARHTSNCSPTAPPQQDEEENEIEKPTCWDKDRKITYWIPSWPKQILERLISFIAN